MKRNVTKEIKTIARERVGRVKGSKVIVPKTKKKAKDNSYPTTCDDPSCFCPIGRCYLGFD